jgi:hypothetical protein
MKALNKFIVSAKVKAVAAGKKVEEFLTKDSGDSQVVVALILIAVAVGLCLIFKSTAMSIMKNVADQVNGTVTTLVGNEALTTTP